MAFLRVTGCGTMAYGDWDGNVCRWISYSGVVFSHEVCEGNGYWEVREGNIIGNGYWKYEEMLSP